MLTLAVMIAANVGAVTTAPAEAAPVKKEKMVCKSERFVGSHLSQRVCKPQSEWDAAKVNSKNLLDRKRQLQVDLPSGE